MVKKVYVLILLKDSTFVISYTNIKNGTKNGVYKF